MMTSNRPPTAPQTQRRMSVNPFAAVLQDDDHDDAARKQIETLPPLRFNTDAPLNDNNKSGEDNNKEEDDDDECSQTSPSSSSSSNQRVRPPRPSMTILASKMSQQQQRRRRRSSARFLQLSKVSRDGIGEDEEEEDDDNMGHLSSSTSQKGSLQEMYQTAIRMNAENKINTTNSWNLHIIDQMDTLLSLNDGIESTGKLNGKASHQTVDGVSTSTTKTPNDTTSTRVNFTKASCTLDASVKIYSYRVDDVHLTSYKVLANLNRTQNNKNDKPTAHSNDDNLNNNGDDEDAINEKSHRKESYKASSGSTLESNIGMFHSLRYVNFCIPLHSGSLTV